MLLAHLACLHWHRHQPVTNQETGAFIEADHRILWVVGKRVEGEKLLHASEKVSVELANAPGLGEMRFQFVFFRMEPTVVCDIASQKPASTTFSASRRRVQRS